MAEIEYKRLVCAQCQITFESPRKRKYCCTQCNWRAQRLKINPDAAVRQPPKHLRNCKCCEKDYQYHPAGQDKGHEHERGLFCSRACRSVDLAVKRGIKIDSLAIAKRRYKAIIQPEIDALCRIAMHIEKPKLFRIKCKHCIAQIVVRRNGGLHKQVCDECITASKKISKSISKAKRRAVERGATAENINPINVFRRDKWRCRLCGTKTPQKLRGTYEQRAPELDHVLPLSKGGSHTWGNVQCACRACNNSKGNRPRGQFSLEMMC